MCMAVAPLAVLATMGSATPTAVATSGSRLQAPGFDRIQACMAASVVMDVDAARGRSLFRTTKIQAWSPRIEDSEVVPDLKEEDRAGLGGRGPCCGAGTPRSMPPIAVATRRAA